MQGLRGLPKMQATSGAQFLIAAEMLTAQVVSLHAGELGPVNSDGGTAPGTALGCCRKSYHLPPLLQGAPTLGHIQSRVSLLRQPTKVIIIKINCGDGLPNSVQRGYYAAIKLQQNVATTDLAWFELMTQK